MRDSRERCKRKLDGMVGTECSDGQSLKILGKIELRNVFCCALRILSRLSYFSYKPSFGHLSTFKITTTAFHVHAYLSVRINRKLRLVVAFDSVNKK